MEERITTEHTVVILSSINWGFLWQRQQTIATYFARAGYRVVFVEGLPFAATNYLDLSYYVKGVRKLWRKARPMESKSAKEVLPQNLTVYVAIAAPPKPRILELVNTRFFVPRVVGRIAAMGIRNPVVWSFQPTDTAIQVAEGLKPRSLVYDCVANFAQVPGVPRDIAKTEMHWLKMADLVLVDSSFLRQKHAGQRPDLIQLPPGVDYELFNQAYTTGDVVGRPVRKVCFFGGMGAHYFDFDIVESIADAGFNVSLIGHKHSQHPLFDHPNVEYVPAVPQAKLPALLKPMDALFIPYELNGFTQGVFPNKVYECLATGKPTVATPLPDLRGELSKYIYLASSAEEFVNTLRRLPEWETQDRVEARLALARNNSWKSRFDIIFRNLGLVGD